LYSKLKLISQQKGNDQKSDGSKTWRRSTFKNGGDSEMSEHVHRNENPPWLERVQERLAD